MRSESNRMFRISELIRRYGFWKIIDCLLAFFFFLESLFSAAIAKLTKRNLQRHLWNNIFRIQKKKYNSSTPETTSENKLNRDFYATAPNEKWTTDVTEFKVPGEKKKLYLSAIIDLYDRYPVSYVISSRNDNKLVFKTFDKAISSNPHAKPVFHSDRGIQYTSNVFQKKLKVKEMEQSMSRVGHCIDNGPTEGFWGIIKTEMYQMYEIMDEASLRYAIKDYIRFYREERPQDRYHCKTPLEVRTEALSSERPEEYPIPENKRIEKYKEKWCA